MYLCEEFENKTLIPTILPNGPINASLYQKMKTRILFPIRPKR
jgi:hypothetical protein